AYRQTAQLNHITPVIAQGIRNAILELASFHQLQREEHATKAHLMRLHRSEDYLSILRLLLVAPRIDLCVHLVLSFIFISVLLVNKSFFSLPVVIFLIVFIVLSFYLHLVVFGDVMYFVIVFFFISTILVLM